MSNPVPAERDTVTSARNRRPGEPEDGELRLERYILSCISENDRSEDARRRQDRIGGNMLYSRHWNVQVPPTRVSMTVNYARALVEHRGALQTKQQPIPVITSVEGPDTPSTRLMRGVVMDWWKRDGMQGKLKQARLLCDTTRTSAFKAIWDPGLYGNNGDVTVDVVPGWRLILDPTTRDRRRMRFAGDRALMTRERAAMLYPKAALEIETAAAIQDYSTGGSATSPVKDAWDRFTSVYPGVTVVAGIPTLEGYTSTGFTNAGTITKYVEIVELYLQDPELVDDDVPRYDEDGKPIMVPVVDKDGAPQFEELPGELIELPDGSSALLPMYRMIQRQATEKKKVRKYPWYRRVTMLLPDRKVIDDVAWDFPLPYALMQGGVALDGPWTRGVMLELETLQNQLNVSACMMMENLRFSALRVAISYNAGLEANNLSVNPGDVLEARGEKGSLDFLQFPQLSEAWSNWLQWIMLMMEKIVGVDGVMNGEQIGRVDSMAAYDYLAEITGSRITASANDMEETIADLIECVGAMMQKGYTEARKVKVDDLEGNVTIQHVTQTDLIGTFYYAVRTGSSLAWAPSQLRQRVLEEYQQGLRDKVSVWQALNIEGWQGIRERLKTEPPQEQGGAGSPPKRTRQTVPKQQPAPVGVPASN